MNVHQIKRKGMPVVVAFFVCIVMSSAAFAPKTWALPAEHEVQRLLLSTQQAIGAGNMDKAAAQLERIQGLNVEPPAVYYFYQGKVFQHQKRYVEAKSMLETYVVKVGAEGKHYIDALNMITKAEEAKKVADAAPAPASAPMNWKPQSADDYLSNLRELYLVNNDVDALVAHINQQLAQNPFHGSRLKTKGHKQGAEYSIEVNAAGELLIKEKDYRGKHGPRLDVSKMDIFGVDPLIQYGCDFGRFVCWLYHPVHKSERWILMDRNDEVAADVSKAMSRLLRILQKGPEGN